MNGRRYNISYKDVFARAYVYGYENLVFAALGK
jgi:hypothetical protein